MSSLRLHLIVSRNKEFRDGITWVRWKSGRVTPSTFAVPPGRRDHRYRDRSSSRENERGRVYCYGREIANSIPARPRMLEGAHRYRGDLHKSRSVERIRSRCARVCARLRMAHVYVRTRGTRGRDVTRGAIW